MARTLEAQLTTARMLLAQFMVQLDEYEHMTDDDRRTTPRGQDLSTRINGLREGHQTWKTRVTELEHELGIEPGTEITHAQPSNPSS